MSSSRPVVLSDLFDVNPKRSLAKGHESTFVAMADLAEHQRSISSWTKRPFKSGSRFQNGDVLVARITPCLENGKTAFVDILDEGAVGHGSTEFIVLSARDGVADPLFGYYLATSPRFRDYATSRMIGSSGRQRVSAGEIGEFRLEHVPTLEEQRAIAEVLGSLDDAIENHLAQHRGRVALLVSLGPATRCETIVGGFELTIGGDWGADEPDDSHTEAVLCLRGKDLEDLLAGAADDIPVRYLKPSSVKKRQLQSGDVLTAGSGTLGPTLLVTESLLSGFSLPLVYSNFVKRIRASSSAAEPAGLFSALHGMWKSGAIDQFRTGTAMPNLDAKALVKNVETSAAFKAVPNEVIEDLLSFDDVAAVRTLQSIRDALLPKLVSGEVRIKDPERLLDQAA